MSKSSLSSSKNFILLANQFPKAYASSLKTTAKELGYQFLPANIAAFKSRERYCELKADKRSAFLQNKDDIAGSRVHVVMSLVADSNKFFVDAINTIETLKEYGAESVHVILPFAPYARQDRHFDGRMVSMMAKTFPKHLKSAGADQITTFDVHSKAAENFYTQYFGKGNVHFVSAADEIVKAVRSLVGYDVIIKNGAPDGADKPSDVAQRKALEVCYLLHGENCNPKEHMFGIVKGHTGVNTTEVRKFTGNVQDVVTLEIDDLSDSGGTLKNGATTLKAEASTKVIAGVTHIFCDLKSLQRLTAKIVDGKPNPIDHVIVTDSILGIYNKYNKLSKDQQERLTIVPVAPLVQQALKLTF